MNMISSEEPGPSLSETTFRSVLKTLKEQGRDHPPLISVPPTASIQECLGILAKHNILSVPVSSHTCKTKYTCILSVLDIIGAFMDSGKPHETVFKQSVEFAMTLEPSRESYRVVERDIDDTIAETLSDFADGLHRILLSSVKNPSEPSMLFTPSDVLRYTMYSIQKGMSSAPLVNPKDPIKTFNMLNVRELYSVTPEHLAQDAFQIMWHKNVMALPVLASDGKIIAGISNSSLRGMTAENIGWLRLPVLEFLERVYHKQALPLETCTTETSLGDIINDITSGALHRIWVTENGKCVNVITLGDLIRLFKSKKNN